VFMWVRAFKYIRIIESVGVHLRIVSQMIINLFVFFMIIMVFICGFSMAFQILLGDRDFANRSWGQSIVNMFRVAIGDADWTTIQESGDILAYILFITYIIICTILMLNLLIAMLNQSYTAIIEKARSEYLVERAGLILGFGKDKVEKTKLLDEDEVITDPEGVAPALPIALMKRSNILKKSSRWSIRRFG